MGERSDTEEVRSEGTRRRGQGPVFKHVSPESRNIIGLADFLFFVYDRNTPKVESKERRIRSL